MVRSCIWWIFATRHSWFAVSQFMTVRNCVWIYIICCICVSLWSMRGLILSSGNFFCSINYYSVSLASHVSTCLLIRLSAHLYHHHHSHHPSLRSFTRGLKPTFSTNPSHLNTSSTLDCLHASWFIFSFLFLFVPCGGLRWLLVSFLLYAKYTLSYHTSYLTAEA